MTEPERRLRSLIVEDSQDDAELVALRLERAGFELVKRRVASAEDLRTALAEAAWDVVISDYGMPGFDAPAALAIVREIAPELPFIIVSGSVGEELAVRAMKDGAHDFFLKDRLDRLPSAVEREVREARLRAERREALERLRASEEQLKGIFEQVIVGIVQLDRDGRFTLVNQKFAHIVGRTTEELTRMREHDITHPDDLPAVAPLFERASRTERAFAMEKRYVRSDGLDVWVNANVAVLSDQRGQNRGVVMVVEDISDRRRVERERERLMSDLERTVKVSEMFVGVLGHDLRNPLMTITMGATLLFRECADGDSERARIVTRIARSSDRMGRMIDQLLDFTRIRMGKGVPLATRETDLGEVVRQATEEITLGSEGEDVRFEIVGETGGRWDRDRLLQLASNLIANAVGHRDGATPVTIRVDGGHPRMVKLEVANSGVIPASILPAIFDPLRSTKITKRDRASGLGLGLFITKQIAHAHGGSIRVDSDPAGGTTRFVVELPREIPTEAETRPQSFELPVASSDEGTVASGTRSR
jgi:phosphoserine phosphatase RsbU/P